MDKEKEELRTIKHSGGEYTIEQYKNADAKYKIIVYKNGKQKLCTTQDQPGSYSDLYKVMSNYIKAFE